MTAPTLTRAEAAHIARAQAILRGALNTPWPGERNKKKDIAGAVYDVRDALDIHWALVNDSLHWEAYDPELSCYAEPYDVALTKSAEDADEVASALAEVIGRYCGVTL